MGAPMPFGQFVPGESAVHMRDARVKLAVTLLFTVVLFMVSSWWGIAIGAALVVGAIAVSRIPVGLVVRGLRPIAWLLAFTVAVNALRWRPDEAWVVVGPIGIDSAGLQRGLFFSVRIMLLICGTSLVALTTSPVALTDALSRLMRPLSLVRFPVDDVAMMLSIALRFLPTTAEEAERIVLAQTARGARFERGGLVARTRAWVPVLVPLFVRLFQRADSLAVAMEARCYTGRGRTRLHQARMRSADWATLVVSTAALLALAVWF